MTRRFILTRTKELLRALGICTLLGLAAIPAFSGSIAMESETAVRSFERVTGSGTNKQVAPVYEYMRLDVEEIGSQFLSFHAYGWGRLDAANSGYYDHQGGGELIYGYLELADSYQDRSLRLGRQHVFEGVADDSIDGVRARTDLGDQFSVSAYGGLPLGLDDVPGRGGDSIWGGRLSHRFKAYSDVGLSYKTMKDDGSTVSSMLGVDSSFLLPFGMSLYGNSVRNMETSGWAEHNYELRIDAGKFTVCPLFELFRYDDYFGAKAPAKGPFLSMADSDERLRVVGANLDWRRSTSWNFGAKAKSYSYDLDGSAWYASASADWFGKSLAQAGGEVGRMQGVDADKKYLLMRIYCYMDRLAEAVWADFISADLLYTLYDEAIYGKDYACCVSVGSGKRYFGDKLEVRISADYSADPYFNSDIRAMMTVVYRFSAGF
ncbi:MAG: hypothetical protein WCL44_11935 [bacterium]